MLKRYTKIIVIGILAVWTIAEAGTWEEKSSMPTSRRAPAGVEAGGKIYVIGGCGGPRSNEEYNPVTNSWATRASLPGPRRRGMGAVAGEVNEKVYFFGGHQGPAPGQTVNFNDEYNPAANSWTTKASMPTATEGAAVGVVDGKIYVIGGYSGTSFLNTVQEYDQGTDSWTTKAPMPTAGAFITGAVVDGKIYVIGGYNGSCLNTVQEYDPEADSWTTKAPMQTARYWLAADVIDGKIYVVGGYDGSSYLTTNEVYDPATDSWTTETTMPTARSHLVAVEADGKIYAIGGVLPGGDFTGANEEFSLPRGDAAAVSIDAPPDTVEVQESYIPIATVKNLGEVALSCSVACQIDDYESIQFVSGLMPDSTEAISFDGWEVPEEGIYNMAVFTILPNDSDPTNDSLTKEIVATTEGIEEGPTAELPEAFNLLQNYPNPFNPITEIEYSLPRGVRVKLEVYDVIGQRVATLVNQHQNAGHYRIQWKTSVTSGIYFLRIEAGEFSKIQKMVIME
ncbi:T9SS type A sorting domain-containing protein [candidate division WOR-3 bacterium]|nr:T9SS type A sorting domain-containing protein [candidate division WOR-3 bacterium]